jgi:hypothetical protein
VSRETACLATVCRPFSNVRVRTDHLRMHHHALSHYDEALLCRKQLSRAGCSRVTQGLHELLQSSSTSRFACEHVGRRTVRHVGDDSPQPLSRARLMSGTSLAARRSCLR